jgi:uncharacterized protein YjaZ
VLAQFALSTPISDVEGLQTEIGSLRKSTMELHQALEVAFQRAEQLLPAADTQLCVFAADPEMTIIRDMGGVSGLTAGAGKIIFRVRPEGPWIERGQVAFAHEYHHSTWTERYASDLPVFDLAEYLVFEGRADSFAHLIFPQQLSPWDQALTPKQELTVWKRMQDDLGSPDLMAQRRYMFGGQGIPRWAGYTIGFHIVQAFLRSHPRATVENWTKLDAHDLIKQSGYKP